MILSNFYRSVRLWLRTSAVLAGAVALALSVAWAAQQAPANAATTPAPDPPDAVQQPPAAGTTPATPQTADAPANVPAQPTAPAAGTAKAKKPAKGKESASEEELPGGITEDELKQLLVGKALYLRGGYLDDSLSFNEHGKLIGHSAQGSYTLCGVEIERVRLTKHKVELDGARYALHFLGALTYEDPKMAADRVKITPKKKMLKISIDREQVVRAKKTKAAKPLKGAAAKPAGTSSPAKTGAPAEAPNADQTQADADQTKAEIASAPAAERPADPASVTSTLAPEHATAVLKDALNKVFAEGLDQQMLATMPAFWQLYYAAAAAKSDYLPTNATMLRQSQVDRKARLLSNVEPGSNQYAQANGVAGVAIYRAVVEGDGTAGEIAVARPIGFGLDENAVDAIRKAKFEPAMKDGKPVPVLLDLSVQFRIFSDRTAAEKTEEAEKPEGAEKPAAPVLPGPYSVGHP